MFQNLITGKRLPNAVVDVICINGVHVDQLIFAAIDGDHMLWSVHVIIGGRGDIGPVGFDVTQMQTPWRFTRLIHEFNRAAGHIRVSDPLP